MKKIKKINPKQVSFTYEEYISKFFPKSSSKKSFLTDNPTEFGLHLAKASIDKLEKALS